MNRFCHNCGAPTDSDARFCARCGVPLAQPQPQPSTQQNVQPAQPQQFAQPQQPVQAQQPYIQPPYPQQQQPAQQPNVQPTQPQQFAQPQQPIQPQAQQPYAQPPVQGAQNYMNSPQQAPPPIYAKQPAPQQQYAQPQPQYAQPQPPAPQQYPQPVQRGGAAYADMQTVLIQAPGALNIPGRPWAVAVEGASIVARWNWMDATFFAPHEVTDETRRYTFTVTLSENGTWKEIDVTEKKSAGIKMGGGKIGFGSSSSTFKGKTNQKSFSLGMGQNNQTGQAGLIGFKFDTTSVKQPIRDYLTSQGWKKKG